MVDTRGGAGGVRAAVRAHRLAAFGTLVVLLTGGPVVLIARDLGQIQVMTVVDRLAGRAMMRR
jgi:hypothetical protein